MSARIGIFTLRIMGPDFPHDELIDAKSWDDRNQKVMDNIGEALDQAEDAVNDKLPEGFFCKVEKS